MLYVYEDWTREKNSRCFYVGQGTRSRVIRARRNNFHTHVAKKFGLRRICVFESKNVDEINKVEILLIKFRNTFHYSQTCDKNIACNFTPGGDVNRGFTYKLNAKQREARSKMICEINKRPGMKEKQREIALETWKDPEIRKKRLKNLQNPETIAARIKALKTNEVRDKIKEGMNKPGVKEKIIASNIRRGQKIRDEKAKKALDDKIVKDHDM